MSQGGGGGVGAGGGRGGGQCARLWAGVPIVTRLTLAANLAMFIYTSIKPGVPRLIPYMLCAPFVYTELQVYRLVVSTFVHADVLHIAMNMFAFVSLGCRVELALGSFNYLGMLWIIMGFGNIMYVVAGWFINELLAVTQPMSCAVGYSGVIFGILMVESSLSQGQRSFLGFTLPGWAYPWMLLIILSLLIPQVSFYGHLFGICGGWLFGKGFFCCAVPRQCVQGFERRNEEALLANLSRYLGPYIKCPEHSPLRDASIRFRDSSGICDRLCQHCQHPCPGFIDACLSRISTYLRSTSSRVSTQGPGPRYRYDLVDTEGNLSSVGSSDGYVAVDVLEREEEEDASTLEPGTGQEVGGTPLTGEAQASSSIPAHSRLLSEKNITRGKEGTLSEQQRKDRAQRMQKAVNKRLLGDGEMKERPSSPTQAERESKTVVPTEVEVRGSLN